MDKTTEIVLRGLGQLLFNREAPPPNRGKVKITKDGRSRSSRQGAAQRRRNRGGGRRPTTSQQRSNRVKSAQADRNKGKPDRVTRGRGVSSRPATGNRGAQGPRTAPQQGPSMRGPQGILNQVDKPRTPAPTRGPWGHTRTPRPGTGLYTGRPGGTFGAEAPTRAIRGTQAALLSPVLRNLLRVAGHAGVVASVFNQGTSANDTPSTVGVRSRGDAEQSIGKYNTMDPDGTIRNRLKVGEGQVGTYEEQFDRAYARAAAAGLNQFTFDGKLFAVR